MAVPSSSRVDNNRQNQTMRVWEKHGVRAVQSYNKDEYMKLPVDFGDLVSSAVEVVFPSGVARRCGVSGVREEKPSPSNEQIQYTCKAAHAVCAIRKFL